MDSAGEFCKSEEHSYGDEATLNGGFVSVFFCEDSEIVLDEGRFYLL